MREVGLKERPRRGDRRHPDSAVIFADDQHEFQQMSRFANHLYVTDTWLANNSEETGDLIARLLGNGSVRIIHTNTEPHFESILAGPPDYYVFIESLATDLRGLVHTLANGPTFNLLAYSFLVSEISSMGISDHWVPNTFRTEYAANILRNALRTRVRNGSVNGHYLASFNLYAASRLLGVEDDTVDALERWLPNPDRDPPADFVAQMHLVAQLTGVPSVFLLPVKESSSLSHIGFLGSKFDPTNSGHHERLNNGFSAFTGLEKSLTLLILQRNQIRFNAEQGEFMESFFAKRRVETLEAFCFHSVLLLRHLVELPIRPIQDTSRSGSADSPQNVSERESNLRVGITALENKLATATDTAEREYANLLRLARSTLRFLLLALLPLHLLFLGAPWFAFATGWLDLTAAFSFTASVVAALTVLWLYGIRRPEVQSIAPKAIVSLVKFVRGLREQ
jgi:hypothetical protein